MNLAYFSPLNPQPSGISDYSEELLPYLAAHARVDLFVDGFEPSNTELRARFRVFDYRQDPSVLKRLTEYDAALYHMGNDHRYHAGMFDVMRRHAGVVVFHDFALQNFFLGLGRARGDMSVYLDELAACHGEEERARVEDFVRRGAEPPHAQAPLSFPLNCRLARDAEGIIVHSEWSRTRLQQAAPGVPIEHIQMPVKPLAHARDTDGSRRARGVAIATFGLIIPGKGIERVLGALASLRGEYDFHYTLVGEPSPFYDIRALVRAYGMEDRVSVTGHVTLAEFERRIAETDIALNIRERTVGETSASLCRIMAAGVPAIVSNVAWFAELPDDCVVKIDADEYADALLLAYLKRLIEDETLRRRIGENARLYVAANHDIERSAARYAAFIREVVEGRARRQIVKGVARELALLGTDDEEFLRSVSAELSALAPLEIGGAGDEAPPNGDQSAPRYQRAVAEDASAAAAVAASVAGAKAHTVESVQRAFAEFSQTDKEPSAAQETLRHEGDEEGERPRAESATGRETLRLRKVEGVDYKRAAREYPQKLDAERHHYLFTKPFYNLANKPPKHTGDGMDAETHRHFCDFANMTVALALPAGRRILDVGCGSGWLSEYLARLGYEVTGIDISPELIEIAQQRTACVPYDVDHETPLLCRFLAHDVESAPLAETFDAAVCYDSLHHFEDEHAVLSHISQMIDYGGMLFILEGGKPDEESATAEELTGVMREYETLESPFDPAYLRALLSEHGFLVVGDYVSVNGLFHRETVEGDRVQFVAEEINYLLCKKVVRGAGSAAQVADSRVPRKMTARITTSQTLPQSISPGAPLRLSLRIENTGDTVWLTGPASRRGACMLGIMLLDEAGVTVSERHGEPPLPRALAPDEHAEMTVELVAPDAPGIYQLKIDLVAQHVCWFEQTGSEPLVLSLSVQ